MKIKMESIGFVQTDAEKVPRHWTISDLEGKLVIDDKYTEGLKDIKASQRIVVIFYFHKGSGFTPQSLIQRPPNREERLGVFSTCSPIRPNSIGMSVLEVLDIKNNIIYVKGLDMLKGTPILDIKPHMEHK